MQLLPVICIYFKSRPLNPSLQKSLIIFLLPIKTATPKSCLKPSKPSSKIMPAKKKNQVKESSSSNESSSYEVESILEKRIKNGKEQYKVVWRGYPIEEATWQPRSNMNNCSQMIVEFQLGLLTKKDKQEMFQALLQTEDEIQDQVLNTPYNIYETNINAVLSSSVIQQCKRMGLFLDNAVTAYKSLPEHSQIQEVVQAQDLSDQNQPSYFLVKVKGNSCLFKIQRDLLLSDQRGRMKIIDYYESLVYSK